MKKAASRKKNIKETSTYLDFLPQDIKENILGPYREQVRKDKSFFWSLIEQMLYRLNEDTMEEGIEELMISDMENVLKKYNIDLKFYKTDEDEWEFEEGELVITLDLLTDLLKNYVEILQAVKYDKRELNDYLIFMNRTLKDDNIPLRIVALGYENSDRIPGDLEIVQINNIRYEIDG